MRQGTYTLHLRQYARRMHTDRIGHRPIPGAALAAFVRQTHRMERENPGSSARNRLSGPRAR